MKACIGKWCGAAASIVVLAAPMAWAAETPMDRERDLQHDRQVHGERYGTVRLDVIPGSKLIGMNVSNPRDEKLGDVKDVVVDLDSGRIAYVVLASGTHLGLGGNYFALPWKSLKYMGANQNLIVNATKEQFEAAKGFDKNHWPDFSSNEYRQQTYRHYGVDPYSDHVAQTDRKDFWVNRLSKLDDRNVQNPNGEKLGEIEDLMIDTREGRIAYALLDFGGTLGINQKRTAVPWSALKLDPNKKVFILNADKATLQANAFDGNRPDYTNEQWARKNHEAFNSQPYWETFGYAGGGDHGMRELFSSGRQVNIHGTVQDVQHYSLASGEEGVRLLIKSDDGRMVYANMGAASRLNESKLQFSKGDTVEVRGHEVTILRADEVMRRGDRDRVRITND